jgi:hypothetical protein
VENWIVLSAAPCRKRQKPRQTDISKVPPGVKGGQVSVSPLLIQAFVHPACPCQRAHIYSTRPGAEQSRTRAQNVACAVLWDW